MPMPTGTVLVVDDDEDIVDLLKDALHTQGYQVLTAIGGGALQVAREFHPDVILLDIHMPGMDGVEISMRLRKDPATAGIPLIAMSALDRLRSVSAQLPVDDRLPKPFALEDLYTLLTRWISAS
jgi:two-component system phosphate regulon response regulator PhoB